MSSTEYLNGVQLDTAAMPDNPYQSSDYVGGDGPATHREVDAKRLDDAELMTKIREEYNEDITSIRMRLRLLLHRRPR